MDLRDLVIGMYKKNNIKSIQAFQNKVLRGIVNSPWYFRNDLQRDLMISTVKGKIQRFAGKHEKYIRTLQRFKVLLELDREGKKELWKVMKSKNEKCQRFE